VASATSSTTGDGERFHADPIVEATELLLQDGYARRARGQARAEEVRSAADVRDLVPPVVRRFTSPTARSTDARAVEWRYAVMVTAAGSGYSAGATWR